MKNTKKRRIIVLTAMVALLAVVLAMGGTTFAKYVTSTEVDTQSATVARWGFVVSSNADDLWGEDYKLEAGATFATKTDATTGLSVSSSSDGKNVVAPGTTGLLKFSVVGQAEVKANIVIALDGQDIFLKETTNTYLPIVWKLYKGTSGYVDLSTDPAAVATGNLEAIKTYINTNVTLDPNATFDKAGYYTLTWEWAFDNTANTTVKNLDTVADDVLTGNQADTVLGYAAEKAANPSSTATVNAGYTTELVEEISLTITVTQVQ